MEFKKETCPSCGDSYTKIGAHWAQSSCSFPTPDEHQQQLLRGMLMGDASVTSHGAGARLEAVMSSPRFLEWLDSELGVLSTGVRLNRTAEEHAARDSAFKNTSDIAEDYQDTYSLRTRTLPWLSNLREWYSGGKKAIPRDMDLTPTEMKMWYVSDGCLTWITPNRTSSYVVIGASSQSGEISELFSDFPVNPSYNEDRLAFKVADTEWLMNWMGDAPPGFEYKFKWQSYDKYKEAVHGHEQTDFSQYAQT